MRKSKLIIIIAFALIIAILTAILTVGLVFDEELAVIRNVEKVDDYGFFVMDYTRQYELDELAEKGVSNDQELIDFIIKKTFKGIPIKIDISDYACSTFNAVTPQGDYLLARNFDWGYSPSMLVYTHPENGYASVSMVNLSFLAYDDTYLPDAYLNRLLTLAAPYVPMDGMNETGLAIGVLQLMGESVTQDNGKTDMTTTAMIRLVLDRAATVEEAVALFNSYDMHESLGACYHYQIADASGASVILEYVDGEINLLYPAEGENYIAAANFYLTQGVPDEEGFGQDRVQTMRTALSAADGVLSEAEAMELLSAARISSLVWPDGWEDKTQWSVVYNLTRRTCSVCVGMDYSAVYSYRLG